MLGGFCSQWASTCKARLLIHGVPSVSWVWTSSRAPWPTLFVVAGYRWVWHQPSVSCWPSHIHPGEAPAPTRSCSKLTPFPALDFDFLCSLCLLPPLAPWLSLASFGVFCTKVASPVVTTTLPGPEPLHDGPEGEQHGLSPVALCGRSRHCGLFLP